MARIRSVKPEHWNDKELPNISIQAHLLWIGMWNFSDDDGIIEADPLLIRSQVFPRRTDIRTEQLEQWIGQLVKARFVIPFEYNGSGYYIHRTFKTHQKIEKAKASKIPKNVIDNVLKSIPDESGTNPRPLPDSSPTPPRPIGAGEERKGLGEEGRVEDARARGTPTVDFSNGLIYDIEKHLVERQKEFEAALMIRPGMTKAIGYDVLKKYHLWLQREQKYPKPVAALIAGFQTFLLNEKNIGNGNKTGLDKTNGKLGTSEGRTQKAKEWGSDFISGGS